MIKKEDIDFNKERRNQESTETGDVSRKPHKFLGYNCEDLEQVLKAQAKTYIVIAENDQKISREERTGVFAPSF